ncbi:DUF188 domain-containing protein [Halobacillus yeomjeoni]|nr:DUF188 domain-containing protein [Halobacillus yeomjeoni]MCA0982719.1 DUF188 domain-containing protein [Halobacillus yeomjeoni]
MSNNIPILWVDADSCPVQEEIMQVGSSYGIAPRFIATVNHYSIDKEKQNWTFLDHGSQNVDLYIMNHVKKNDIVITQDLSLAVLLTAKGVYVLTPRGTLVKEEDANTIMQNKHIRQQTMKKNKKWKGPSSFSDKDREKFQTTLQKILSEHEGIQ